ncbi:hypothetical protein NDU88_008036, partial [Pleurodeles waltl]
LLPKPYSVHPGTRMSVTFFLLLVQVWSSLSQRVLSFLTEMFPTSAVPCCLPRDRGSGPDGIGSDRWP